MGGMPKRSSIHRKILLVLGGIALVAGVVVLLNWDFVIHRIGTVKEGVLYRSAELSPAKLESVVEKHGIRTVIDLRQEEDADEQSAAAKGGANYVWLPSTQVPVEENIQAFLDIMDDPAKHPVLVHCEHGVGRTGVLAGVYRKEYEGWATKPVLEEARWYAFWGSYWDGQDKTDYLERYVPRDERDAEPAPAE